MTRPDLIRLINAMERAVLHERLARESVLPKRFMRSGRASPAKP